MTKLSKDYFTKTMASKLIQKYNIRAKELFDKYTCEQSLHDNNDKTYKEVF